MGNTLINLSGIIFASLAFFFATSVPAQTLTLAGVETSVPSTWRAIKPTSSMHLAQFQVPAASHAADAELAVFFFGAGQGGTSAANITRWQSQFKTPDGGPVKPVIATYETNGMAVTQAEFQGSYARGVGAGPAGPAKPNQTLLAAIVEGPQGKLFVQLYGPTETVNEHRQAFDTFIRSMRQVSN